MDNAQQVIDAAMAFSSYNDLDAASNFELVTIVNACQRELFAHAAAVNPRYFGKRWDTAAYVSGLGWKLPDDCELPARVTQADGSVVYIVPEERVESEVPPRVTRLGRYLEPVGTDFGTPAGTLKVVGARTSASMDPSLAPNHATNSIDPDLPREYRHLLVLDLASYLASKDGARIEEMQSLQSKYNDRLKGFLVHVANQAGGQYISGGTPSAAPSYSVPAE